jgi:hypothetical protein
MPRPVGALLQFAREALLETNHGLAARLGSSRRTGQRWVGGGSQPSKAQLGRLAGLLFPTHEALAAEIAQAAGTTLGDLGLVHPVPPKAPTREALADSVVCAAADAMQRLPAELRPALLAAFARADAMGLSVAQVLGALEVQLAPARPEAVARGPRTAR